MPGVYAQRLYARTHTSGRTKSVQDAPTTNDHDCTDAEPTKRTQPLPVGKGFGDRDREFSIFVKFNFPKISAELRVLPISLYILPYFMT